MKKICIVSPSLKIGGIERALSVLANYFVSKDYAVSFISCLGGDIFYELDSRVTFVEPSFSRTTSLFNKMLYYPRVAFYIRKNVKRFHPDAVLSFGDKFNPLVLFALIGIKFPVYISDRTNPDFKFNFLVSAGKGLLYPRSAGFIAQTELAAQFKRNQFGNKLNISVIPNAIKEVKLLKVERKPWIVCVSRLSHEKGVDRLMQSFALLKNIGDWNLVYAGSGPMENELKSLAKKLKVEKHVIFLGRVSDVDTLLCESSMFVLPSRREGFPNALCEAMAAGLPAICFDCISTRNILENGLSGVVVRDNDLIQLAEKMQMLMNSPSLREKISMEAIKIRERLSVEKIGKLYLNKIFGLASSV